MWCNLKRAVSGCQVLLNDAPLDRLRHTHTHTSLTLPSTPLDWKPIGPGSEGDRLKLLVQIPPVWMFLGLFLDQCKAEVLLSDTWGLWNGFSWIRFCVCMRGYDSFRSGVNEVVMKQQNILRCLCFWWTVGSAPGKWINPQLRTGFIFSRNKHFLFHLHEDPGVSSPSLFDVL